MSITGRSGHRAADPSAKLGVIANQFTPGLLDPLSTDSIRRIL
jgi:hypothetical protein